MRAKTDDAGATRRPNLWWALGLVLALLLGPAAVRAGILSADSLDADRASPDASGLTPLDDDFPNAAPIRGVEADPAATDNGIAALDEAVHENAALRDLLQGLLPTFEPAAPDREFEVGADLLKTSAVQGAPATSPNGGFAPPRPATALDTSATEFTNDDDGPTARQVLQSIAPARRGGGQASGGPTLDPAEIDDNDIPDPLPDLLGMLLNSRLLGDVLGSAISVDSERTFSVFGLGELELNVDPEGGNLVLTDTTSNLSFAASTPQTSGPMMERPHETEKIDIFRLALDYLESSTGIMVSILAGTLLVLWSTIRAAIRR